MPGSSSVRTRSSLVAYMSTGGVQLRPAGVPERPKKLSKRRFTSVWMSDTRTAPNDPKSKGRTDANAPWLLLLHIPLAWLAIRQAILSMVSLYHLSVYMSNIGVLIDDDPRQMVVSPS